VLKHKLPRLHHLEQLKHLDPKALESGCKDGCPSKDVLKQIRCESRRIATPDDNVWLALQKMKEDQHQTSRCSATLQVIMIEPPTFIFYSMKSITVLRTLAKKTSFTSMLPEAFCLDSNTVMYMKWLFGILSKEIHHWMLPA